jgi:hypothetical protein
MMKVEVKASGIRIDWINLSDQLIASQMRHLWSQPLGITFS